MIDIRLVESLFHVSLVKKLRVNHFMTDSLFENLLLAIILLNVYFEIDCTVQKHDVLRCSVRAALIVEETDDI